MSGTLFCSSIESTELPGYLGEWEVCSGVFGPRADGRDHERRCFSPDFQCTLPALSREVTDHPLVITAQQRERPRQRDVSRMSHDDSCNETVVYAFLARGTLPLWPVWESYLAGCPKGSSTVVVHTQGSLSERNDLAMKLAGVGGSLLPAELTAYGNPTFSYQMVAMTLALYRYIDLTNVRTPDGCSPRFIHLSSERDAPVATCAAVRARLAASRGRSLIDVHGSPAKSSVEPLPGCKRLPVGSTGFYYASQWTTLDATHAFALTPLT